MFLIQAHAAAAILNFSESCTPEILTPYLDGVISKLLVLLQVWWINNFFLEILFLGEVDLSFLICSRLDVDAER